MVEHTPVGPVDFGYVLRCYRVTALTSAIHTRLRFTHIHGTQSWYQLPSCSWYVLGSIILSWSKASRAMCRRGRTSACMHVVGLQLLVGHRRPEKHAPSVDMANPACIIVRLPLRLIGQLRRHPRRPSYLLNSPHR